MSHHYNPGWNHYIQRRLSLPKICQSSYPWEQHPTESYLSSWRNYGQAELRKCLLPFKSQSFVLSSILKCATAKFAIFICRFIRTCSWVLLMEEYTPSTFMHKHGVLEHALTYEEQNNRKYLALSKLPIKHSVTFQKPWKYTNTIETE